MAYTVEPIDVTNTPKEKTIDPRSKNKKQDQKLYKWWLAQNDGDLVAQVLSTVEFLKKTNANRIKQASVFSRLASGKPLYNFLASNSTLDSSSQLPIGRPTANVCYSCSDTLVSRISQDRPKPIFLTDAGNYKKRNLAKQANAFIQGELYRTKSYEKGTQILKDACHFGDGFLKVYSRDNEICVDRTLETELLVDFNDGYYGLPRQLGQIKLSDRDVAMDMFPKGEMALSGAVHGNVDSTPRSTETSSDQIIIAEFWHLPSGKNATDGRHVIVCSEGVVLDEKWTRPSYPFVKMSYNENPVGFFSQGLVEILMPTQMEIYRMLIIASQAIEMMGVPRIYLDQMAEIVETSFNNRIGTIIKGKGPNPPQFLNAVSNTPEIYEWIKWLIENAYQMSGISAMSASGSKPQGLNSGEAIRSFDQIQEDRFAALARKYQTVYTDLSYLIIEEASELDEKIPGGYSTMNVSKDGTEKVDFKAIRKLEDDYTVQCYEESSLPKDPAGRQAKLSEMLAAGEITNQEFRRLSNLPDLEQSDRLAAALEERILWSLDEIVENGDRNYDEIAPDQWILDPSDMAMTISTQYINLFKRLELEEKKLQLLRDWQTQVLDIKQKAMPVQVPQMAQGNSALTPPTAPPAAPIGPASGVAA